MSLRRIVHLSLLFSILITLSMSFILVYFLSFRLINKRIKETYESLYNNYKEILKNQEKNFIILDERAIQTGRYYHIEKQSTPPCNETPHYRVIASGVYYGINRLYPNGCYFVGINIEETLRFMKSLVGVDWVICYDRRFLKDILVEPIDNFMKGKIVIDDLVIDKFSNDEILSMPLDVKGYMVYGGFVKKQLIFEAPFANLSGIPIGKIVFVKDISNIYRES
ncbi:MAG: hypothetical protein ACK4OF_02490, partial [Aquificaceae bacterium]